MKDDSLHWFVIGLIDDIPRRGARRFRHGDEPIAVFRTADDRLHALTDRCPHAGGPLSQGIVHDGCVTCPLHNWVIALDSGEAQGADCGRARSWPVRLDGRKVLVGLSDLPDGPDGRTARRTDRLQVA